MRHILIFIGILILTLEYSAAQDLKDFLSRNSHREVFWLGVDFSHAQIIGEISDRRRRDIVVPHDLVSYYMPEWNTLILGQPHKFDIEGMLRKSRIRNDISTIMQVNENASAWSLIANYCSPMNGDQVVDWVQSYPFPHKDAYGVLFVMECMDRNISKASMYVVIMDLLSGRVLMISNLEGRAQGLGMVNYWGGAIYHVMQDIERSEYRKWVRAYGR